MLNVTIWNVLSPGPLRQAVDAEAFPKYPPQRGAVFDPRRPGFAIPVNGEHVVRDGQGPVFGAQVHQHLFDEYGFRILGALHVGGDELLGRLGKGIELEHGLADAPGGVPGDGPPVVVEAVDPEILKNICLYIVKNGKTYSGVKGAKILIDAQEKGIRKVKELGATVKVNMVLCPGINDHHVEEVAKTVSEWGADFMNIIPLIPQYKFSFLREPGCNELYEARAKAEKYIKVFKHCQRCRADAVGIPGKLELSDKIYDLKKLNAQNTFSHG